VLNVALSISFVSKDFRYVRIISDEIPRPHWRLRRHGRDATNYERADDDEVSTRNKLRRTWGEAGFPITATVKSSCW
jgi:hypothetical protein